MTPDGLITSEFDDAAVIEGGGRPDGALSGALSVDGIGFGMLGRSAGTRFRSLEDDLFGDLEPADFFDPYDRWEGADAVRSGRRGRR
jgi:hypothetical protein